jgi:hypothetical protein
MPPRGIIPKIDTIEHPNYRTINVSGVFGGAKAMFFEVILYSDEMKSTEALASAEVAPERASIKRTLECRLVIDPFQAKSIGMWLMNNVTQYEKIFGRIPSPEELQSKGSGSGNEIQP